MAKNKTRTLSTDAPATLNEQAELAHAKTMNAVVQSLAENKVDGTPASDGTDEETAGGETPADDAAATDEKNQDEATTQNETTNKEPEATEPSEDNITNQLTQDEPPATDEQQTVPPVAPPEPPQPASGTATGDTQETPDNVRFETLLEVDKNQHRRHALNACSTVEPGTVIPEIAKNPARRHTVNATTNFGDGAVDPSVTFRNVKHDAPRDSAGLTPSQRIRRQFPY